MPRGRLSLVAIVTATVCDPPMHAPARTHTHIRVDQPLGGYISLITLPPSPAAHTAAPRSMTQGRSLRQSAPCTGIIACCQCSSSRDRTLIMRYHRAIDDIENFP